MTSISPQRLSLPTRFPARLRVYLAERFPVGPSLISAALIAVSADLVAQGASNEGPLRLDGCTLLSTLLVFFGLLLLRLFDEAKDFEEDTKAHPERPVQRGVIALHELAMLARVVVGLSLVAAAVRGPTALLAFAFVIAFAGLMRVEFFCPRFLRRHIVLYALTHQVVMPLMVLAVFVARDATLEGLPAFGLQALLAALLGLTYEVGRKVQAPAEEHPDDDTYSSALGIPKAVALVCATATGAAVACAALVATLHLSPAVFAVCGAAALFVCFPFVRFASAPMQGQGKKLLGAAALCSLFLYGALIAALFAQRGAVFAFAL